MEYLNLIYLNYKKTNYLPQQYYKNYKINIYLLNPSNNSNHSIGI
jgi:hypothetical protein